jgi:hypothetical protein
MIEFHYETNCMPTNRRRSKRSNKWMKIIRRVHLYLGLILLPWVLFFGVSGFLFNHNSTFFGGSNEFIQEFNRDEVDLIAAHPTTDLSIAAAGILAQINSDSADYQIKNADDVALNGYLQFTGPTDKGAATVTIDPVNGTASISIQSKPAIAQDRADFEGKKVSVESLNTEQIAEQAALLLKAIGIEPQRAMELKSRGAAELRFQVIDASGRSWNTTYNLATEKLSARASDDVSHFNLYSALTRLHKQHGYPDQVSARWFWTLFTDTTALTLIFWGLSGAIMWWQMKPTRLIGIAGLSLAAVLAALIFGGAYNNLNYSRARETPAATQSRDAGKSREAGKPAKELKLQATNQNQK